MSFIKKISLVVLVAILFSVALNVSAQSVGIPEIYVKDLKTNTINYKVGDKLTGTFTAINARSFDAPNLYYTVSLMGDYNNSIPNVQYGSSPQNGPITLMGNESKKIEFSYIIPNVYKKTGLGIQIRMFLKNGSSLGWADAPIGVTGGLPSLEISSPGVKIGDKIFDLQQGPTLYENDQANLILKVKNTTGSDINLVPVMEIYNRSEAIDILDTLKIESFLIKAGDTYDMKVKLPNYDYTPRVYTGLLKLLDLNGNDRAIDVAFRYIVAGQVVTINSVSAEKNDESLNVRINYSGTPYDVLTQKVSATGTATISIKLSDEDGKVIGTYNKIMNFNEGTQLEVPFIIKGEYKQVNAEVSVINGDKELANYNGIILNEVSEGSPDGINKYIPIVVIFIIIIVLIVIIFLIKRKMKNRNLPVLLTILFIGFLASSGTASAYTTIKEYTAWSYTQPPKVTINSPVPVTVDTYSPGEAFNFQGTASVAQCSNSNNKMYVSMSSVVKSTDPEPKDSQYSQIKESSIIAKTTGEVWSRRSTDFSSGTLYASTTPGTYRIYFWVTDYFGNGGGFTDWSLTGYLYGYQEFQVVAPTPPVLTANTSASCGGKINLSWSNTGANSYKIYKNASTTPFATTTSLSVTNLLATSTDTFRVKAVFGTTDSDYSNTVTATPSNTCPPLALSCSASPNPATVNQDFVTLTARPVGGTGDYKYSWEGTGGLQTITNSATASYINHKYTATGIYSATSTVSDGVSTKTAKCGQVINGGSNGGCTTNCIDVRLPEPTPGACGGANGGEFTNGQALGTATNRCYYTLSTSTPNTFSPVPPAIGYWSWTCSGVNGSPTPSGECRAYQSSIGTTTLNCTGLIGPSGPVNVNTNTSWDVTPLSTCTKCDILWAMTDSNNSTPVYSTGLTTWNKIFTTIGLKNVYVKFATSTPSGRLESAIPCTASTTVVQTGGVTQEN
jgi:hypothetical protein